jgi:hypothetical protein
MAAHFDARLSPDLAIENVSGRRVAGRHQRPPRPQSSSASSKKGGHQGKWPKKGTVRSRGGSLPDRITVSSDLESNLSFPPPGPEDNAPTRIRLASPRTSPQRNVNQSGAACRNVVRPRLSRGRHRRRQVLRAPRHQGRTHQCDARRQRTLARRTRGIVQDFPATATNATGNAPTRRARPRHPVARGPGRRAANHAGEYAATGSGPAARSRPLAHRLREHPAAVVGAVAPGRSGSATDATNATGWVK